MIPCPNEETCGGTFEFRVEPGYDGDGVWTTFVGYDTECVERTCTCVLTPEQWAALEAKAAEGASDPDPDFGLDTHI